MSLDFFLNFYNKSWFIYYWWPWSNFFTETWFIQFIIIYLLYLVCTYNNIYYTLLYTFFEFFFIGIGLSILQLELFTAFLWLIECTVIFIFLVLLFYVNVKSTKINFFLEIFNINYLVYFIFLFFFSTLHHIDMEFFYTLDLNFFAFWDDYYEAVYNFIMNDLVGFLLSYYVFNSFSFILIGFILLVGSVLCVTLYKYNKNIRTQTYNNFLMVFDFFKDMVSFLFYRKQNLIKQGNALASIKLFKKI